MCPPQSRKMELSWAVHPSQKFVYFGNSGSRGSSPSEMYVGAYQVDPNSGALTAVQQTNFTGVNALDLAMHPSGKYLYAADHLSSIVGYSIDQNTGALTHNAAGSTMVTLGDAVFVALAPSGKFLYYGTMNTGAGQSGIVIFQIDPNTGAIVRIGQQATQQLRQGRLTSDGKVLVTTVSPPGGTPNIAVFRIDAVTG